MAHKETGGLWLKCYSHYDLEFADEKTYRICGECGHVYSRRRDLRKAWRQTVRHLDQPRGLGEWWWRMTQYCQPAHKIYHCQECAHDF